MPLVTAALTEVSHVVREIPFPPMVYGAISIIIFAVFGLVMWSYRDVSTRHTPPAAVHPVQPGHDVVASDRNH